MSRKCQVARFSNTVSRWSKTAKSTKDDTKSAKKFFNFVLFVEPFVPLIVNSKE